MLVQSQLQGSFILLGVSTNPDNKRKLHSFKTGRLLKHEYLLNITFILIRYTYLYFEYLLDRLHGGGKTIFNRFRQEENELIYLIALYTYIGYYKVVSWQRATIKVLT